MQRSGAGPWQALGAGPGPGPSQFQPNSNANASYGNLDRGQTRRGAPLHRGATLRQQQQQQQQQQHARLQSPSSSSSTSVSSSRNQGEILPTSVARSATRRNPNLPPPVGAGSKYTEANAAAHYGGANLNSKLTRGKTLTRPDRHVAPAPLINPQLTAAGQAAALSKPAANWFHPWSWYVTLASCFIPSALLSACGIKGRLVQRAWREKWALCSICLVLGGLIGFFTIGLNSVLCPDTGDSNIFTIRLGADPGYLGIDGWVFSIENAQSPENVDFFSLADEKSGQDISGYFDRNDTDKFFPACSDAADQLYATANLCAAATANASSSDDASHHGCLLEAPTQDYLSDELQLTNTTKQTGYAWSQVGESSKYMVLDGLVLNMQPYLESYPKPHNDSQVDRAIREVLSETSTFGRDATKMFKNSKDLASAIDCLKQRYVAGRIDKITPGCFVSQLFLYVSLTVILGIVLARFFMACVFSWFISKRLCKPPKNLKRSVVSPAVLPEGANIQFDNTTGTAPWIAAQAQQSRSKAAGGGGNPFTNKAASSSSHLNVPNEKSQAARKPASPVDSNGMINSAAIGAELFTLCLVTCYSEGREGIKATLDSISAADYSDARKMLFIVCDGIITGSGESASTPQICIDLLDRDERFGTGEPARMSFLSVGSGSKAYNEAQVYAGHYTLAGRRTPMIVVCKTGGPQEANDKKPGNRGKRDSQMVLMNFLSRVTYNDRMTPLDYDLFRKMHALMGVTPDFFETCLMVDADTKVHAAAIKALVNCMHHDPLIMGVCGETRIENKRQSWVTMIQVFEYYISHHLAKGFESVFGGVTCLPGCFSMYRLKARKLNDTDWVPILIQSDIVREYNQSDVQTLHQKNLLLLGEDRFLTTCMIRTFPKRKMMFCPQARCRTLVPDEFKVLLSQRRRWINSTVHNLMELVRVPNLCGTFCFSMQFVVFIDLIGTVVLPVAICLTYYLVISSIINPPSGFSDAIPLMLLVAVLGLPGILIIITTGKIVYLAWLVVYLIALPIWNCVLPAYAYWHFDDFSWGETRKVAGEGKDTGHEGDTQTATAVPLRRWEDWERSRLRKIKRDAKRRQDMERKFGNRLMSASESDRWDNSETASLATSGGEDDRYGPQIGQYDETAAGHHPPPPGLYRLSDTGSTVTYKGDQMAAILDEEWDEDEDEEEDNERKAMANAVVYQPHHSSSQYSVNLSDEPVQPYGQPLSAASEVTLLDTPPPFRSQYQQQQLSNYEPITTRATGLNTSPTAHNRRRSKEF